MSDAFDLRLGDCLDPVAGLASLPASSVAALVTDPPAGIGFMAKDWDRDRGGRAAWVAWLAGVMRECLRVLKPGAHGLVWALPRTSHWTATALEDGGFEIRDVITHHFATGFPKSVDVSKAIDEAAGAEREVLGPYRTPREGEEKTTFKQWNSEDRRQPMITAPATEAAKQWDGWGTALKPASEHWILVRKPLAGTIPANVQEHGAGGLNIDGCRIASGGEHFRGSVSGRSGGMTAGDDRDGASLGMFEPGRGFEPTNNPGGRWPANLVLSHAPGCEPAGHRTIQANGPLTGNEPSSPGANVYNRMRSTRAWEPHGNGDGTETVEVWRCVPGCPVAEFDAQSGISKDGVAVQRNRDGQIHNEIFGAYRKPPAADVGFGGSGGASRFFFCAKPARRERDRGCISLPARSGAEATGREDGAAALSSPRTGAGRGGGARNIHPTVKPVGLMEWLITLITPPGGLVLDPFAGSGTTGVAAITLGFPFLGWEQAPEYFEIARARLAAARRRPEQLGLLERAAPAPTEAA